MYYCHGPLLACMYEPQLIIGVEIWQTICFKMGVNFWRIDSTTLALNSGAKALNNAVKSINSGVKSINGGAKSINGGGTRMNEPATHLVNCNRYGVLT